MQEKAWEREYRNGKLLTLKEEPQQAVKDFLRWLRKEEKIELTNLTVLDLGSGTGRNTNYIAELGNTAVGYEISDTAISIARERAHKEQLTATFEKRSIGSQYPLADESINIVLDVTSSNSLNESERALYLKEVHRVLKPGGYFFVRILCKDGDTNAKNLIKLSPGPEKDTYTMKELGLTEHVYSKEDFIADYSQYFKILSLEKTTSYTRFNNQSYKRNFWIAYLRK